VAALFFLGLLSKPMLVTFPFVLLLLDWWPLRRMELPAGSSGASGRLRVLWPPVREKIPLLAMSIASCVVTVVAQGRSESIHTLEYVSPVSRCINAVVSYATYLWKTVWPSSLAVLYPLETRPGMDTHGWQNASALLLVAGLFFLALRQARRRPYLLTGWLWYLGTLVPVIGLVQVGDQSMADRYTYIPLIGVFLAVTWGAFEFAETRHFGRAALKVVVPAVVLSLAVAAWSQAGYWRDNVALYSHALAVTEKNWKLRYNLGLAYIELGRNEEGIASCREALRIKPDYTDAWNNIGAAYVNLGRNKEGIASFREALRINPDHPGIWYNFGLAYFNLGRYEEAIASYRQALRINPDYADAWNNLGLVFVKLGQDRQAAVFFQNALRIRPDHPFAARNLNLVNR
jgi:tetratricopeptide (TPR) repeat protein